MNTLLTLFSRPTTKRPGLVLAFVLLATVGLAALAANLQTETELAAFGDESATVAALDRVSADFGGDVGVVLVIFDAGAGGDVLTADGLRAIREAQTALADELGASLRATSQGAPAITSLPAMVGDALEAQGIDLASASDDQIDAAVGQVLESEPRLAALTSEDRDLANGRARATFLAAELDPGLSDDERTDAGERAERLLGVDEAGVDAEWGGYQVAVFSPELLTSSIQGESQREMPVLLGLALLGVALILGLMLRSAVDVAIGLAGLVITVIWTFGLISLTGPGYLGWRGPLSQIGIIVPVLLVGLGIDYAVHLTARYREQRASGQEPTEAARTAIGTVGAALVLATVASALGFATTAAAPIQIVADFGVFIAMGVICAFLVMVLFVPAVNVLRERRRSRRSSSRELSLTGIGRAATAVAVRAPVVALGVAGLLVAGSLAAATALETEFNQEDFIPDGSTVGQALALQQELFGGDLSESTYVVIDGDHTDPDLVNALLEAHDNLADVDGVRTVDGQPQAQSIATLTRSIATQEPPATDAGQTPAVGEQTDPDDDPQAGGDQPAGTAALQEGWTGQDFDQDADLAVIYDTLRQVVGEEMLDRYLDDDATAGLVEIQTSAAGSRAETLRQQLETAFRPVVEAGANATVTSNDLVVTEIANDLGEFQANSILITLAAVLLLLVVYYAASRRRPLLGLIAMLPAAASAAIVLGVMWLAEMSFNPVTAMMTAISVAIGVPYGVHVVNRFLEDLDRGQTRDEAMGSTLRHTGGALTGSALTTLGAFVMLSFAGLVPIQQLGILGATAISFALLTALFVEAGALSLWARRRQPNRDQPHTAASNDLNVHADI